MSDTKPCLGCGVKQYGRRIQSLYQEHGVIKVCEACAEFEQRQVFVLGKVLGKPGKGTA